MNGRPPAKPDAEDPGRCQEGAEGKLIAARARSISDDSGLIQDFETLFTTVPDLRASEDWGVYSFAYPCGFRDCQFQELWHISSTPSSARQPKVSSAFVGSAKQVAISPARRGAIFTGIS